MRQTLEMSIVIGTLNRCDMLVRSIESLKHQTCKADRFEIIVVDNGSSDATRETMAAVLLEVSNLRYVEEPLKGLSSARNRGIAAARAPLVAFVDDDAEADPRWAESILSMFHDHPDLGAAGGPIRVRWPNETNTKPDWVPESVEGYYGKCDYGCVRRTLQYPDYPYGSNMVIRRDLLLKIDGFNQHLGPTGGNLMAAGEQDMFYRLYKLSPTVMYEPAALVHHWAPPERVTRRWSLRRAFRHGISSCVMQRENANVSRPAWVVRTARAMCRTAIGVASSAIGWATWAGPSVVMSRTAFTAYWAGYTRGAAATLFSSGRTPAALSATNHHERITR